MGTEETQEIAFPEGEIQGRGDLENILVQAVREDKSILPEELPDQLTSFGIERYINWISEQAKNDPRNREYAGELHIDANGRFIYSKRPNKGSEISVTPRVTKNYDKFATAVLVHTHPDSTSFSDRDLLNVNLTIIQSVSTTEFNYILIRNPEILIAEGESDKFREDSDENQKEWAASIGGLRGTITGVVMRENGLTLNNPQGQKYKSIILNLVKHMEVSIFGADLTRYMHTLDFARLTANKYGLGFYYSEKDGIYRRVKPSFLNDFTTRVNQELVERAYQELPGKLAVIKEG